MEDSKQYKIRFGCVERRFLPKYMVPCSISLRGILGKRLPKQLRTHRRYMNGPGNSKKPVVIYMYLCVSVYSVCVCVTGCVCACLCVCTCQYSVCLFMSVVGLYHRFTTTSTVLMSQ